MADEVIGYCDPHGNFMGYDPRMTLIPNMIPARMKSDGTVEFVGNPRVLPKGKVIETDAGFGTKDGSEQVLSGLVDDKGAHVARTNAVPVGSMPQEELDNILMEVPEVETVEETDSEVAAQNAMDSVIPEADESLKAKVAARVAAHEQRTGGSDESGGK